MQNPGFTRFVTLDEVSHPHLFRRVTNAELPIDGSGIEEGTDIRSRLVVQKGITIQDISIPCLKRLFEVVRIEPGDLGGLVIATCHPGDVKEMTREIGERSGIHGEMCGVDDACNGFVAASEIAYRLVMATRKPIAIVTSEILSDMINWEPPAGGMFNSSDDKRARGKAAKIFGDRSAGVFVKPPGFSYDFEILDTYSTERDDPKEVIELTSVENAQNVDGTVREGITPCINMPGRGGKLLLELAPEVMIKTICRSIHRAVTMNQLPHLMAPAHIVSHQANGRIIEKVGEQALARGFSHTRIHNCIQDMGNVSAATIPTAMAMIQDQIEPGALIAMPAVGAGSPEFQKGMLTRGCVLARRVKHPEQQERTLL